MERTSSLVLSLLRLTVAGAVLLVPGWWAAGRLRDDRTIPFFRLLCAIGLALVGYIAFVNLLGRLTGNSIAAVLIYLLLNAIGGALLLWRRPADELRPIGLLSTWRMWLGPVVVACALGLPQWFVAVSTNYWDEAASSAIHLTAPNQFAEGIFPPRHNALPDVSIKYHYAFAILSGTLKWLLGVSANVAVDLVSTGLWLFVFLFVLFWFRKLEFDRLTATWGAFSVLLGGGLAWLYLPRIEAYGGFEKAPPASDLVYRYDAAKSWLANLKGTGRVPSLHLRNADGSLSNLPWDIAAQFQQHAVSLGIAMTLIALYLFTTWRKRSDLGRPLLAANIVAFSAIFLGHAVFGTVAAVTAGTCLLLSWVRQAFLSDGEDAGAHNLQPQEGESKARRAGAREVFIDGLLFVAGVAALAFLHGGMLARGAQYGGGVGLASVRRGFGYSAGGLGGFLHWNIAGFGLPLALAILAWCLHRRRRDPAAVERNVLFTALTVFGVFSYLVPQLVFYSSETYGVEQFTEISKFFFSAHFALALLSAFGVAYLGRIGRWPVIAAFLLAAITPAAFCYANSVDAKGKWLGFYYSPYFPKSIEEQMGRALGRLKKTNHDVYFDASADERHHGYLGEMLIFGGSVFTMTPSAFERTGVGFRLSEEVVARRFVQNSRMARLLPGAAEQAGCGWYYSRPFSDLALAPVIVRSRFGKLLAEGSFVNKFAAGLRALYAIEKPTADLDRDIERYWSPNLVTPAHADGDGDGKGDLVFFDYVAKRILCGQTAFDLPDSSRGEYVNLYVGRFPGEVGTDFLIGRMKDTRFRLGKRIEEVIEVNDWAWSYRDSRGADWQPEYDRWYWDMDIPFIADLDHGGFDSHLAYRPQSGEWMLAPDQSLAGPKVAKELLPVPFGGRFLAGSRGDLGVWSIMNGTVTLQTIATGKSVAFRWGGSSGFILVPGDYDGDGYDEVGVFNRGDLTWYWRHAPDGPISQATFGSKTGIPVPYDYNHDGRLDLAYWEPREGRIYVSFTLGRSVDRIVQVPPHSIPAFVNMY
jgi:hypothetical protein